MAITFLRNLVAILALVLVSCGGGPKGAVPAPASLAGAVPAPVSLATAWTEMNLALQGRWQARADGNRIVTTSYRTVSKGSALVETFTTASGTETMTVFHRDGDALMATHYCAQGNQVRLKATEIGSDRIRFQFVDATNVRPGQGLMQKLVFALRPTGFDQESVYLDAGKLERTTLHFFAAPPRDTEVVRLNSELSVRSVAPNTYVVNHEPFFSSNVLVAKMPDGTVIVCSSPMETEAARVLMAWVRGALAPSRIVAINTHFHLDGSGGNEAYREAGAITYASDHTQRLLSERGESMKRSLTDGFKDTDKSRRMLAMKIVAADNVFPERDGLALTFGGEEVRVVYPGAAHSPDNVLVLLVARKVLFGGCMVKSTRAIGNTGDADLEHWPAAVDVARNLRPSVVVPGHGTVSGPELFDLTDAVVRDARAAAPQ
jgi:glyoxylase-like metal-dependent hydrolase (beta-lactamase superfamily II)